jgi:hypothetical protein
MISFVGGIVILMFGIVFFVKWFAFFLMFLKATLPILFILGGIIAVYLGAEDIKEKTAPASFSDETNELKNEVESLKEEIKGLKEERRLSTEIK